MTYEEFEKTDDALRDVETAREQRGGTREDRPREIQAAGSRVKVLVIPTNEELEIAREVLQIINGKKCS